MQLVDLFPAGVTFSAIANAVDVPECQLNAGANVTW